MFSRDGKVRFYNTLCVQMSLVGIEEAVEGRCPVPAEKVE